MRGRDVVCLVLWEGATRIPSCSSCSLGRLRDGERDGDSVCEDVMNQGEFAEESFCLQGAYIFVSQCMKWGKKGTSSAKEQQQQ